MDYNKKFIKIDEVYHLYKIYTEAFKEDGYFYDLIKYKLDRIEKYKSEAYRCISDPFKEDVKPPLVKFFVKRIKDNIKEIERIFINEEKMYGKLMKKIYPAKANDVSNAHSQVIEYKDEISKILEDINDTCEIILKKVEMIKTLSKTKIR